MQSNDVNMSVDVHVCWSVNPSAAGVIAPNFLASRAQNCVAGPQSTTQSFAT